MKYCLHCFKPEDECCIHKYVEFPKDCVCDKGEWLSFKDDSFVVPEICDKFEGIKTCSNCEHDKYCHKQ